MKGLKFVVFGMLLFIGGCIMRLTMFYVAANGGDPTTSDLIQYTITQGDGLALAVVGLYRKD